MMLGYLKRQISIHNRTTVKYVRYEARKRNGGVHPTKVLPLRVYVCGPNPQARVASQLGQMHSMYSE